MELADILFVGESAVSKWERGISYPDITLISAICKTLDIDEHELITSSDDTESRVIKRAARRYQLINDSFFYGFVGLCIISIIVCFIVNLAVNHTLSWFFIVLASNLVACSFIPVGFRYIQKNRIIFYISSTFLSLTFLFFVCSIFTHNFSWIGIATSSVLLGYIIIFLPMIINKMIANKMIKKFYLFITIVIF